MKFMQKIKSLFILLALVLSTSCTFLEGNDEASVTFTIDRATASKIAKAASSRSAARAPTSEETAGLYLDIALKGDYTASKTIAVAEGSVAQFDTIPVGVELYAEAVAYRVNDSGDKSRTILYTGKSETIKINPGMNYVELLLDGTGSLGVTVTIPAQNDLNLTCTTEEDSFIFSAVLQESSSSEKEYLWFVDGVAQDEKSGAFTLNTEGMNVGTYQISVVCEEKSGAATVKIE